MKNKKWVLTMVIIVVVILIIFSTILKIKNINVNKIEIKDKINKIELKEFKIKDRLSITKNNAIYIGNNEKELENDFYDLKIIVVEGALKVYLNKLWHTQYGKDYIEDNYLVSICRELVKNLEFSKDEYLIDDANFEYVLYKYIKDNYIAIRSGENVKGIVLENVSIELQNSENIPLLIIRGD